MEAEDPPLEEERDSRQVLVSQLEQPPQQLCILHTPDQPSDISLRGSACAQGQPSMQVPVVRNLADELGSLSPTSPSPPSSFETQVRDAFRGYDDGQENAGGQTTLIGRSDVGVPTGASGSIIEGHFAWEPYEKKSMDLEKNFDRQDLAQKTQFWRDVEAKFGRDDEDCRGLISNDESFTGINPASIVPHPAAKLEEVWSEVRSFFSIYEANFRMSGTHSREFKNFCQGRIDVLYLWYWLQLRPEALSNVRGGLYAEDEYDSLATAFSTPSRECRRSSGTTPSRPANCRKRTDRSPPPPSDSAKKKSKPNADPMDILLTMVGRIVTAREAELLLGREQEQEVATRVRAEHHKMLDDIRNRISEIECAMSSAASPIKSRLQVDLDFFLEERKRIMDRVRSQDL